MIVHDFGQRQCGRRQKRDQKPEQTETDHTRFLENGSRDRGHDEKSYESETRPETRIICGCKRIEVVVGGETAGPEERLEVEQRHVRLRDQVIVRDSLRQRSNSVASCAEPTATLRRKLQRVPLSPRSAVAASATPSTDAHASLETTTYK